jgi:hypothetical protein
MSYLYRYEAKGIQAYILATQKLTEMIGASALVEELRDAADQRARAARGKVIMAAAGNATIEFPDAAALQAFAVGWPLVVAQHAPGLQLVQAWAPREGDFADAMGEVMAGLESARNRARVDLPEAGPLVARAGRTGRPAVRDRKKDGLQDAATMAKADQRSRARESLLDRLAPDGITFTDDLDRFGEGYLAVLHADGNGVGQRIIDVVCKWPQEDQRNFSSELSLATTTAAKAAVVALVAAMRAQGRATAGERARDAEAGDERPGRDRGVPFRPLVLGGDDFTAILRAEDALDFVRVYLSAFQDETRSRAKALGGGLTACAGIAFVKNGFPLYAAHALAEELCKHAKKSLRRPDGRGTSSGMAFHRVTTAMFDSLESVLEHELSAAGDTRTAGALLGGPWRLEQIAAFNSLAVFTKQLPRGTLREWLRLVQIDRSRAYAHWQRMLEVLENDPQRRDTLRETLAAVGASDETGFFENRVATPVLDALTVAGFGVRKEQGAP